MGKNIWQYIITLYNFYENCKNQDWKMVLSDNEYLDKNKIIFKLWKISREICFIPIHFMIIVKSRVKKGARNNAYLDDIKRNEFFNMKKNKK